MANESRSDVTLGAELAAARSSKRLSLRNVAREAEISPAYLQKLEADKVESPSPRVLQRLAEALEVSYTRLMARAGYTAPRNQEDNGVGSLQRKLATTGLSDAEERAVAAFIDHLVQQRRRG